MGIFPASVYNALKTRLNAASELSYVDTVVIQKYDVDKLPDFSAYCIVISPQSAKSYPYEANQRWIHNEIMLVLLAKVGARSEEDIIVADSPPTNVGILIMYEDVYSALYGNTLGGAIELYPKLNELDNDCSFNIIEDERDTFVIEARVLYTPRGLRWVASPST